MYGFSTFLPAILKSAGYDILQSNYLTIPVYIFGALCFYAVAFFSDKLTLRGPASATLRCCPLSETDCAYQFLLFANIFGIVGYIILLTISSNGVKYFATFLCAIAVYNGPGINLTWLNVNVAPHYRRATAIGFQQTMGNTAGVFAGQIYRKSPYRLGHGLSLGALCLAQVLIVGKMLYIRMCNHKKDRIRNGEAPDDRKVKSGHLELDFKYHM